MCEKDVAELQREVILLRRPARCISGNQQPTRGRVSNHADNGCGVCPARSHTSGWTVILVIRSFSRSTATKVGVICRSFASAALHDCPGVTTCHATRPRGTSFSRVSRSRSSTKPCSALSLVLWRLTLRPGLRGQVFTAKVDGPLHCLRMCATLAIAVSRIGFGVVCHWLRQCGAS